MGYKKIVGDLEDRADFKLNPYDHCRANTMVNGHQITVIWYVYDLQISHKYPRAVTRFIKYLDGIIYPGVKAKHGVVHDYLGMKFDFSIKDADAVDVDMTDYMIKAVREFPDVVVALTT